MAKAPNARGFTLAEKRALLFEQVSLYAVFLVALIAAAISFVALRSVGSDAGLGHASFLLPIAIDGFGIACSVGIVRSVASGEGFRDRISEWVGLLAALGLSILGNITHALMVGADVIPDYVKIAYAGAIPVIVAYGIHVYGRAMARGISAHVLADDPDRLHFDVQHLGETVATVRAPVAPTKKQEPRKDPAPARVEPAQVAREVTPEPAQNPVPVAQMGSAQASARAVFDRLIAADPSTRPDAAVVWRESGLADPGADGKPRKNAATVRRWCNDQWWPEHQANLGMGGQDPIVAQVAADEARAQNRSEGSAA